MNTVAGTLGIQSIFREVDRTSYLWLFGDCATSLCAYVKGWAYFRASNALDDIRGVDHTAKPPTHWLKSVSDAARRFFLGNVEAERQKLEAEGQKHIGEIGKAEQC